MIIGVPDFLYCCILLIMVLCHDRSLIKKQNNKKCQNRLQKKPENKFNKKKENIYISNELIHIIALILILEI